MAIRWWRGRPAQASGIKVSEREAARALMAIRQEIEKLVDKGSSPTVDRSAQQQKFLGLLAEVDSGRRFLREAVRGQQS